MTSEMLYIDPDSCIDCSACVQVCPVDAISAEEDLTPDNSVFLEINASFFRQNPTSEVDLPVPTKRPRDLHGLRVAVVGTGPAGSYAAADLLSARGVVVDVFERLYTPYGLIRSGVAPDHLSTKSVVDGFPFKRPPATMRAFFGVEIGKDITHEELVEHYHAVIYAVGAHGDRGLGVPGEDLPGSHSAREFVSWYNGHPDSADLNFDLSSERAVVIGNGNVALDVARILSTDPDLLVATDIAEHALDALRKSAIREVVVVGRRGPEQAAYTSAEMVGLINRDDIVLAADQDEVSRSAKQYTELSPGDVEPLVEWKQKFAADMAGTSAEDGGRRITFRYLTSPLEITGTDRVTGIRLASNDLDQVDGAIVARPNGDVVHLDTGLVLRSVGYFGAPVAGLPFDNERGVVPNEEGRVTDEAGRPVPHTYVTGWIKRGPSGVIGTNRQCAAETVTALFSDFVDGRLTDPLHESTAIEDMVKSRCPDSAGLTDWSKIDAAELELGRSQGRPRVKFTDRSKILDALK